MGDLLSWSGAFLGSGDFTLLSVGGAFLSGEGNFPIRGFCGDGHLSFWSGGGAFLEEGDLLFFFWEGEDHPYWGKIRRLWPSCLTGRP